MHRLATAALTIGALALLAPAVPGAGAVDVGHPSLPAHLQGDLDELAAKALEAYGIPGMAVGVVAGEELVLARGFGHADRASRRPVTPRTLFQIGSVSKSFTATLAARLAGEGALSLEDPVARHLRCVDLPAAGITLRHLATHTSGLPRDAPNLRREHGDYPVLAFTHFELYRGLVEAELEFSPGTEWAYSNLGYAVLGHVLELVTETPYEVLLRDRLTAGLGMQSTTVTLWPELAPRLATPYLREDDGGLVEYTPWDQEALAPAGGIASTLEDLGRYVAFQIEAGRSGGAVGGLQVPRHRVNERLSYAAGWFVEELPGVGTVVSVGGDVDGYVGEIAFSPEHRIGTIVLINVGDAGPVPHLGRWLLAALRAEEDPAAAEEARRRRDRVLRKEAEAVRRSP